MGEKVTRSLSFFDGVCLVVGLVLGIGIYQTPPIVSGAVGNEGQLFAVWLLGAGLTIAGALCYIELATTYPEEGGDYYFLGQAFGSWARYLYGWSQVLLIRPGAIAAIAFPCASYLSAAFPNYIGQSNHVMLACVTVLIVTAFNIGGTALGVITQNLLSILSYSILLGIALYGITLVEQPHNFLVETSSTNTNYGLALIMVLFTYGGWSELAMVAGEVDRPQKNFLRSMITGILLITVVYCVVNFAYCNALGFEQLRSSSTPASDMIPFLGGKLVAALVALCCLSSLNGFVLTSARVNYAFGRDYTLFSLLGHWNERRNSPVNALVVQCLLSIAFIILAGSFKAALVYTTAVVWLFYLGVGLSIFVLRKKFPNVERKHPTWGYPITPLIFCASCVYLIQSALAYDLRGSLITFSFVVAGVPFYWWNSRRHLTT